MATKTKINFSVFSKTLNPDEISNLIGLKGDELNYKGEQILKSKLNYKYHIWNVTTGEQKIDDLEKSTVRFLEKIYSAREKIQALYEKNEIEIELQYILYISGSELPSFHIGSDLQKMINELRAEIDIDIYLL